MSGSNHNNKEGQRGTGSHLIEQVFGKKRWLLGLGALALAATYYFYQEGQEKTSELKQVVDDMIT
jgi:hypothetical protein